MPEAVVVAIFSDPTLERKERREDYSGEKLKVATGDSSTQRQRHNAPARPLKALPASLGGNRDEFRTNRYKARSDRMPQTTMTATQTFWVTANRSKVNTAAGANSRTTCATTQNAQLGATYTYTSTRSEAMVTSCSHLFWPRHTRRVTLSGGERGEFLFFKI
jgi:hypothetical protein